MFSGSDHFMAAGHQIINSNRAYAGPKRREDKWAYDDEAVRIVLYQAFPKLLTDKKQRERAGRWARIIQLYFRSGMSGGSVAHEMKINLERVRRFLKSMRHVAAGRTCNGAKKHRKCARTGTSKGG